MRPKNKPIKHEMPEVTIKMPNVTISTIDTACKDGQFKGIEFNTECTS
jgi:hypothetical protein